jgi:hypothetical protein
MDAWNVWQVGQDGNLIVGEKEKSHKARPATSDTSESTDVPMAPLISSITGEPTDPSTSVETKQAAHVHSNADESIAGSTGSPPSIVPGVTPTSEAQDLDQARTGPLIGQSTQENEPGIASAEVQGPSSPPEIISGTILEWPSTFTDVKQEVQIDIWALGGCCRALRVEPTLFSVFLYHSGAPSFSKKQKKRKPQKYL